jgi:ubiquitin-protein ligase
MNPKNLKKWPNAMMKRFERAKKSDEFSIIQADENKLDLFYILLQPKGGHYKDQVHMLEMKTYNKPNCLFPFTPPMIKFLTKIWHPNVSINGTICLDILKEHTKWSPQYGIETVVASLILLLDSPIPSSPLNNEAGVLFNKCAKIYKGVDKSHKKQHAEQTHLYNKCFQEYDLKTMEYAINRAIPFIELFDSDLSGINSQFDDVKID